jgi:hypothetical protein
MVTYFLPWGKAARTGINEDLLGQEKRQVARKDVLAF